MGGVCPPACGQLRRATGTLRQLLLHQAMQKAWRFVGFKSGPRIVGPNLEALMSLLEHEKHHTLVMTAGGFEIDRLAIAAISLRKVQNPSTGVGPDADEGFAIQVSQVSRSVIEGVVSPETELSAAVHHEWANIESYMAATGAVRLGQAVSRKSILEYFAYYSGGVHLDRVKNNPKIAEIYLLVTAEV